MQTDPELEALLSLLDDDDEKTLLTVMSSLLRRHTDLLPHLAELQESADPEIRKKVHQLQSIIIEREKRFSLLERIDDPEEDFFSILSDMHLLWYDSSPETELEDVICEFISDFNKRKIVSLQQAAEYMFQNNFKVTPPSSLDPDACCIGSVFYWKKGCSAILCGILKKLLPEDADISIIKIRNSFALTDGKSVLLPEEWWDTRPAEEFADCEIWSDSQILSYLLMLLFDNAVNSNSYRYIYTIGQAVSGKTDNSFQNHLPYPFSTHRDDKTNQI